MDVGGKSGDRSAGPGECINGGVVETGGGEMSDTGLSAKRAFLGSWGLVTVRVIDEGISSRCISSFGEISFDEGFGELSEETTGDEW